MSSGWLALLLVVAQPAPSPARPLSLQEARLIALEHRGDIAISRANVRQGRARLEFQDATFTPRLTASVQGAHVVSPPTAFFGDIVTDTLSSSAGLTGRLPTGLTYSLAVATRVDSFAQQTSALYDRLYTTSLRATLRQPLLRGAWPSRNRAEIRIAALDVHTSSASLQRDLQVFLADVETAYWRLYEAEQALELRKLSFQTTQALLDAATKKAALGVGTEIDVLEAKTAAARARGTVESAQGDRAVARGDLHAALQIPPEASPVRWQLTDAPPIPALPDLTKARARAMAQRPDLEAARAQVDAVEIRRSVAEDALAPALDVVGRMGITGVSGRPRPSELALTNPELSGGYGRQFQNLDFPEVVVGVELNVPLDNAESRAALAVQSAEVAKKQARLRELERRISSEVEAAHRRLAADLRRLEAATEAERLGVLLLERQQVRFSSGGGVAFDVLRAAQTLTDAQLEAVRARTAARLAMVRILVATGQYSSAAGITFKGER